MPVREDLVELEKAGWRALTKGPDVADAFYREVLDDDVVMLLPGGRQIRERERAVLTMSGTPWDGFVLEDVQVLTPRSGVGLITYGVIARRGPLRYSALVASSYVKRAEGWRLVHHQQTVR